MYDKPVESVEHLNCDQDRQGHGHWWSSLKHLTVNASEVLILIVALHEVRLQQEEKLADITKEFLSMIITMINNNMMEILLTSW